MERRGLQHERLGLTSVIVMVSTEELNETSKWGLHSGHSEESGVRTCIVNNQNGLRL